MLPFRKLNQSMLSFLQLPEFSNIEIEILAAISSFRFPLTVENLALRRFGVRRVKFFQSRVLASQKEEVVGVQK